MVTISAIWIRWGIILTQLLCRFWGFELLSYCLHSKHFNFWAIFPVSVSFNNYSRYCLYLALSPWPNPEVTWQQLSELLKWLLIDYGISSSHKWTLTHPSEGQELQDVNTACIKPLTIGKRNEQKYIPNFSPKHGNSGNILHKLRKSLL